MTIASASEKVFARFSGHYFGCSSLSLFVCLKSVFLDAQNVKYDRDITSHPHLFQGTNSHEAVKRHIENGDKQRERE